MRPILLIYGGRGMGAEGRILGSLRLFHRLLLLDTALFTLFELPI